MSSKWENRLIGLFVLFLAIFPLLHLLLPDRSFSENENRVLASLPKFSVSSLFSGRFASDFESYLSDQFPGRDGWIAVKAGAEFLSGKRESGGVYLADNRLIARVDEPDEALVARNLDAVRNFAEKASVPVYFTLIPTAAEIYRDVLPFGAPSYDEAGLMERAAKTPGVLWASSLPSLSLHRDEGLYYRTDHHWTTLGAYYGYAALAEAMGFTPSEKPSEFTPVSQEFNGTAYSRSGVRFLPPDEIMQAVDDPGVTVSVYDDGVTASEGALYHPEALETKDKYAYFLGGNHPLVVIRTGSPGPRLLLLRDSYADCQVPYLLSHFSEIHLFDLRYNRTSALSYIEEAGIDLAAVSYSAANFISDTNLFLLGR